jgi:hypothetical protein
VSGGRYLACHRPGHHQLRQAWQPQPSGQWQHLLTDGLGGRDAQLGVRRSVLDANHLPLETVHYTPYGAGSPTESLHGVTGEPTAATGSDRYTRANLRLVIGRITSTPSNFFHNLAELGLPDGQPDPRFYRLNINVSEPGDSGGGVFKIIADQPILVGTNLGRRSLTEELQVFTPTGER